MNDSERMRMTELCSAIAAEQDSRKMLDLVEELNRLFELKEQRLKQKADRLPFSKPSNESPVLFNVVKADAR
jgi:exoribonuclease R